MNELTSEKTWSTTAAAAFAGDADTTLQSASTTYKFEAYLLIRIS